MTLFLINFTAQYLIQVFLLTNNIVNKMKKQVVQK